MKPSIVCIKVMADIDAGDCLWSHRGKPNWNAIYDRLPTLLLDDLEQWGSEYERIVETKPIFKDEIKAFADKGVLLARLISAYLPNTKVIFYDDYKATVECLNPISRVAQSLLSCCNE